MVRETISCFLTGGYSEAGYMQQFLTKINPQYQYMQKLPNKTIKRSGMPKQISDQYSGLTGDALINKICELLERDRIREEVLVSKAILIEDDTDNRFTGMDEDTLKEQETSIKTKICRVLGKDMPVLFLYACPEIESWFIADWENGFGGLLTGRIRRMNLSPDTRQYCSIRIHQAIGHNILDGEINPEKFADHVPYIKISDLIKKEIEQFSRAPRKDNPNISMEMETEITNSRDVYYSKRSDGGLMLKQLNPDIVASVCDTYFRKNFLDLRNLVLT